MNYVSNCAIGGELIENSCTTAGYGVVTVTGDNFGEVPGFGIIMTASAIGLAALRPTKDN